ncbi:CotS family spore coat protein [Paenibacillus validus]|uniref:CotS family spore coat protein n=1 Tax=Paenibacillus validus TaxID=44253 RepID=UPI003D2E9298
MNTCRIAELDDGVMTLEEYRIGPWDHLEGTVDPGIVLEQYVPPELEAIAWKVAELYEMKVSDMTLVTSKPDKGGAIWKMNTDRGPRSIKVLHREPKRSLFSVGSQEYLVNQGARVPSLIRTKDDRLYVEAGGKLWIVTEWIESLVQASKIDLEGAAQLCTGLGEFHKLSQGYVPPFGAARSTRLPRWPKYYEKIIAKIGWFRDIAQAYPELSASSRLLSIVDDYDRQAREIYEKFKLSSYPRMAAMGDPHWGLAHQDYGWSNGQMGPGGIWIIDLDGVAYDLPIRDLRKLITSTMDDMGVWDLTWIRGMIEAYHQANPIDRETFELLWLDMAFPNEFYKHVKEIVYQPTLFMETELNGILDRVLIAESTKWQALAELEQDKANYVPGHYPEQEAAVLLPVERTERVLEGQELPMPELLPPAAMVEPVTTQPNIIPISPMEPVAVLPLIETGQPTRRIAASRPRRTAKDKSQRRNAKALPPQRNTKAQPAAQDAKALPVAQDAKAQPAAQDAKALPVAQDAKAQPAAKRRRKPASSQKRSAAKKSVLKKQAAKKRSVQKSASLLKPAVRVTPPKRRTKPDRSKQALKLAPKQKQKTSQTKKPAGVFNPNKNRAGKTTRVRKPAAANNRKAARR